MKFKKVKDLYIQCQSFNYHVCLSWQSITEHSIEIYKGYKENYVQIYYSDGYLTLEEAVKKGLKFMKKKYKEYEKKH